MRRLMSCDLEPLGHHRFRNRHRHPSVGALRGNRMSLTFQYSSLTKDITLTVQSSETLSED